MDKNTVFSKTDAGREALASRPPALGPRLRSLLIMVDGKRRVEEFNQLRGGDGKPMDPAATDQFVPTVYLYDAYPGGIGLSEPLHQRRDDLVRQARALLAGCDCRAGCPACVGPVLAGDEGKAGDTPKSLATKVLALLGDAA